MPESTALCSSDLVRYGPGDVIEQKYRLVRFLGEGAQGSVWLAENLALCADVAIKIVHATPETPVPTLRLEKEARAAAQVGHPAVVRVFDLGRTARGDAFIVMEFLEGENLGDRLVTCGRLSPVEAVRTLLPIADVLHVAHARGIVHRDIKPENVFLAKSGSVVQPKLLDFGIVKRADEASESVITDVGVLMGSPAYLSPEQAVCREDIGRAADTWSFCVVLYECLTGALPFQSENCRELFRQIEEQAPEPILAHGVGDFELWEIVRRGLAKAPADRWPDMHSLGRALAGWLRARGIQDDISGMRLDSKWLARGRTEPAPALDAAESSTVRVRKTHAGVEFQPTVPASARSSRWLAAGGIAVIALPLVLGYGLVSARSEERTKDARVEAPKQRSTLVRAPLLEHADGRTSTTSTSPPSPPLPTPSPRSPEPPKAELAPAAVSPVSGRDGTARRRRPTHHPDLIDPY